MSQAQYWGGKKHLEKVKAIQAQEEEMITRLLEVKCEVIFVKLLQSEKKTAKS